MTAIDTHPARIVTPDVFDDIIDAVNAEVLGRTAEIRAIMLALIARQHVFTLSRPGEAKTMMQDRILLRISGARRFSAQLDAYSDDGALFGPWSIKELAENDVYRRSKESDAIQWSEVADIDEIARAGAATLDSMLRILNEGEYRDAGRWVKGNLSTMVSSANSLPWIGAGQDRDKAERLAALWDRIAFRLWMDPTTDLDVLRAILDLPTPDPAPPQVLAWDDVKAAQTAARALPVEPATRDALIGLVRDLNAKGIAIPSPRRLMVMETIAKANAWLCGASRVRVEHLEALTMVIPHDPEQQPVVDEVVFKLAAPNRSDILKQGRKAAEALTEYNAANKLPNDRERASGLADAYTKAKATAIALATLERKATPGDMPYVDRVWPALTSMHDRFVEILTPGGETGDFRQLALEGKVHL